MAEGWHFTAEYPGLEWWLCQACSLLIVIGLVLHRMDFKAIIAIYNKQAKKLAFNSTEQMLIADARIQKHKEEAEFWQNEFEQICDEHQAQIAEITNKHKDLEGFVDFHKKTVIVEREKRAAAEGFSKSMEGTNRLLIDHIKSLNKQLSNQDKTIKIMIGQQNQMLNNFIEPDIICRGEGNKIENLTFIKEDHDNN